MAPPARKVQGNKHVDVSREAAVNPKELKEWMRSLSWNDLVLALEAHEEDAELLIEMIRLQVPPATPIHPRALGPIASLKHPLPDARYDTEHERTCRQRIEKPRLLKWIQVEARGTSQYDDFVVRTNNNRNNNYNKRKVLSSNKSCLPTGPPRYSVMARGFITRDGNRYAIPPTNDQYEADEKLLHHVCLCTALQDIVGNERGGLYLRFAQKRSHPTDVRASTDRNACSDLFDILRISSRGNFLTNPQNTHNGLPTWFQPTERWFSLSMYLAAKFEMALVQSFNCCLNEKEQLASRWLTTPLDGLERIQSVAASSENSVSSIVALVIQEFLRRDKSASLPHARDCLLRMLLLEHPTYKSTCELISDNSLSRRLLKYEHPSSLVNLLWVCPILQIGSATDQLRSLGREMLLNRLARKTEEELLLGEKESNREQKQNNIVGTTPASSSSQTRRQSKKKSKSRSSKSNKIRQRDTQRGQQSTKLNQQQSLGTPSQTLCHWVEEQEEEIKSSDEETQLTRHTTTNTLDFPENADISNRSRNRNIVLVLGLLDDIVQDVFNVVGLATSPSDDSDDWEDGTTKTSLVSGKTDDKEKSESSRLTKSHRAQRERNLKDRGVSQTKPPLSNDEDEQNKHLQTEPNNKHLQTEPKNKHLQTEPKNKHLQTEPNGVNTTAAWTGPPEGSSILKELDPKEEPLNTSAVPEFNFSGTNTGIAHHGAFDIFASPYGNLCGGFFQRPESIDFAWDTHDFAFDQWSAAGLLHVREQSMMHDLFLSQERREQEIASSTIASIASSGPDDNVTSNGCDDFFIISNDDLNSVEPEFPDIISNDDLNSVEPEFPDVVIDNDEDFEESNDDHPQPENATNTATSEEIGLKKDTSFGAPTEVEVESGKVPDGFDAIAEEQVKKLPVATIDGVRPSIEVRDTNRLRSLSKSEQTPCEMSNGSRSPSPHAPNTPSPTMSPILVSLADLKVKIPESPDNNRTVPASDNRSFSSLPGAPGATSTGASTAKINSVPKNRMVSTLSRENLRSPASNDERSQRKPSLALVLGEMGDSSRTLKQHRSTSFVKFPQMQARDDNDIKNRGSTRRRSDVLESYRTVAARSLAKSRDDHDVIGPMRATPPRLPSYRAIVTGKVSTISQSPDAVSAQSEIGNDDYIQPWPDSRRSNIGEEGDNNTTTRDGSTTITSALSQREGEENLREERDTYRDLCLTLGAEVAKLRNMLASQNQSFIMAPPQTFDYSSSQHHVHQHMQPVRGHSKYFDHPASLSHIVSSASRSKTLAAMSDAGYRGEYESMASMASEDDYAGGAGKLSQHQRQTTSSAASDASVEQSAHQQKLNFTVGIPLNPKNHSSAMPLNGVQSRLSVDISHFVDVISSQLRKQESKRAKSVERMTRLVTALWPRAQVKLYGSHVTGLCLPSSDVDFIICLPAVQKDAPAVAPGVLEGRNAINESSQKVLARKLKNESWIDPRSMKLIERTVVPVIKVATKDTKAKTLRLDITFDSPSHHGLEAVELVNRLLEEYPMIRPLVLVLKQFLLDRGLLTGYTGGLSSYCLFLMTARYLQEQATSWTDCGALLMGFLDFYGNHFDPRTTGISVRLCQYFARPNYAMAGTPPHSQMMWNSAAPPPTVYKPSNTGFRERGGYVRRNSFSDKGNVDGLRGATTGAASTGNPYTAPMISPTDGGALGMRPPSVPIIPHWEVPDHGMPYTFDPLFVEDPLSMGNNVGRNTFRIFQVLRAFSDAHRALVASVEWDMQSSGVEDDAEYSLLKCLLHSEDVVFDL
ncbi:hypothetical protein ACA910_001656 [Epithemia clementina (nom. ined.)]